jgi:hypothetical protein
MKGATARSASPSSLTISVLASLPVADCGMSDLASASKGVTERRPRLRGRAAQLRLLFSLSARVDVSHTALPATVLTMKKLRARLR